MFSPAEQHHGVLGPAADGDFSLMGHFGQVAGIEPVLRIDDGFGEVRPLVVAHHALHSPDPEHPLFTRGQYLARFITDLSFGIAQRRTDGSQHGLPLGAHRDYR
jgi:hypothetical protein